MLYEFYLKHFLPDNPNREEMLKAQKAAGQQLLSMLGNNNQAWDITIRGLFEKHTAPFQSLTAGIQQRMTPSAPYEQRTTASINPAALKVAAPKAG
jgi:hypothetical protein